MTIEVAMAKISLHDEDPQVLPFTDMALVAAAVMLNRTGHENPHLLHAPHLLPTLSMPLQSLDAVIEQTQLRARVLRI